MAIIILGKSECPICNKLINQGDELVGFPVLSNDEKDLLYFFSDAGFHEACFIRHPLKNYVLRAMNLPEHHEPLRADQPTPDDAEPGH